ncbi:hypothetical protein SEPCBS119000_001026 [Sporothrix epigloea]|uniref:Nuclear pore complex protein An-Nup82 n=1 Tax=Sporothrix epigloea TaxID=1892477 RepID=A0ABP0D8H6_9PEZI
MPKIRSFTPSWLSTDSTDGRGMFSPSPASARRSNLSPKKQQQPPMPGPRRTIARRGTEVFVASGREIRWANLVTMKDNWEATTQEGFNRSRTTASSSQPAYRTLKPPVASDIRQLIMSPQANYMAVLTTHTVHICVLPDASHLRASEDPDVPLKTRFFTLGPTTHVTSRQPVVAALWHPLGVNGSAVVTVTRDAVVRLWEISPVDRWSFDAPALSIDVKKLADGTWLDQDFGASVTTNTSYSPDVFDMEVAAACFGLRSSGGWSSMTLYLAMLGGDVYALCPLLPKRFAPPPSLIPSLSVAIVSNLAALEDDPVVTPRAKQLARQQLDWMTQIDKQEPTVIEPVASHADSEPPIETYARPAHPSIVPRLQGPLEVDIDDLESDDEEGCDGAIGDLCDIFVIGEKVDTGFLNAEDDGADDEDPIDGADQDGLSLPVICLVTTTGKLHICLDPVGIEAQWLPQRSHHAHKSSLSSNLASTTSTLDAVEDSTTSARPLPTFQVVDVVRNTEKRTGGWCTFSPDVSSHYSFFVTHPGGITNVSLASWAFRLEQELQESTDAGADFRVRQLVTGENISRQRVYTHNRDEVLATCSTLLDPDLGFFLLSATEYAPIAICFEAPESEGGDFGFGADSGPTMGGQSVNTSGAAFRASTTGGARTAAEEAEDKAVLALDFWKARPAFEIPPELWSSSELSQAKSMLFSSRFQILQHQEVRLSPATLAIFTNAHKIVGNETSRLNYAVAQMFTKLEDLPLHLREQVDSTYALKRRIDMIAGEDQADDHRGNNAPPLTDNVRLRQRLQRAQERHKELAARMESLRRTYNNASARPLSDKERVWAQEVQALEASLGQQPGDEPKALALIRTASPSKAASDIGQRVRQVRGLWDDLSQQANNAIKRNGVHAATNSASAADDMKASVASLVSVNSGGGTMTPSPPASVAGSTAGNAGRDSKHTLKVPADVRKAKLAQVTDLLERETALVEAVAERLKRLGVAA